MQLAGSFVFRLHLALTTLVMGVLAAPAMLFGADAARGAVKLWARIILGGLTLLTGVRYRLEGEENLPKNGAIVAANHQSMWETVALYLLLPKPAFILKAELQRLPVYGWWARPAGNIIVNRQGGAKALRAMVRQASEKIEEGAQVVVFPESTRVKPGELHEFHPGVAGMYAAADAPCVPVAHDSGRYWRYPGMEKRPGEITLRILPPIVPGLDRRAFLKELERQITAARPDLDGNERNA